MKITVDTNVLVRAVVQDDAAQALAAEKVLRKATLVAVSTPCLCEFFWVLKRAYRIEDDLIAKAIQTLFECDNVVGNRPAVEYGLKMLALGGDFADAIIAFEGALLGGNVFVSLDKKATKLLPELGTKTYLLSQE